MKIVRQLGIILLICFLGEAVKKFLGIPIPGNVLGMIILLVCLLTGVIKVSMIEEVCNFLTEHLAFLFLPAGVGLISCSGYSMKNWIYVVMICILSTVVVMVTTGRVVQFFKRS